MADDSENRGSELVAVMTVFLVLTWFSVALRCFVRLWITKSFQSDDWLMIASLAIFTMTGGFIYAGVFWGLGKHNGSLPDQMKIQALKYQALSVVTYIANMAFIKLSIGIFLLRIAVLKRYKWILYISMGVIAAWSTGIFLFDIFQCSPIELQWDFTITNGSCVSLDAIVNGSYAISVLNVLSDWLYALLPIPMIWSVKMTVQAKITVAFILGLGIFASVATLIRVRYLIELANFDDILFASTDALLWTIVEPGIGIIAASIVTLRPLLKAWKVSGFSANTDSRQTPAGGISGSHGPYSRSQELDELPGANSNASTNRRSKLSVTGKGGVRTRAQPVLADASSDTGSEDFILARGSTIDMIRGAVAGAAAGKSSGNIGVGTTTTITSGAPR